MEAYRDYVVYGFMVFLVIYSFVDLRGRGVISLWWTSIQLGRASRKLSDETYAQAIRQAILDGSEDATDQLFHSRTLRRQMRMFCSAFKKMDITEHDKCQCDIEDYINYDFLDYQGNSIFCDHAANGLTALGVLGTFIGMAIGMTDFQVADSDSIMAGITNLLQGMSFAFTTSIVGIILSLGLGTLFRIIRGSADKNLNRFLSVFSSNVLSNQSEAALNQLVDRIKKLENRLSHDSVERRDMLHTITNEFLDHMGDRLTTHVEDMRNAMMESTRQHQEYCDSLRGLMAQMAEVGNRIDGISTSFTPVIEQSRLLSEQIMQANHALQEELATVSSIVANDSAIVGKQNEIADKMNHYAAGLEVLARHIAEETHRTVAAVENIALCSTSTITDSQAALEAQLRTMMLASSDFNTGMQAQARSNIDELHAYMVQAARNLPRSTGDSRVFEQMIEQNNRMIENQERILEQLGHTSHRPASRSIFRRKRK